MAKRISEGSLSLFVPEGVFYNPQMELCRDICSLAVGAIGGKISVADAMCASGVRGLRYKKENKNVAKLALCDLSSKAVSCARRNAKANKVNCSLSRQDARRFLQEEEFDFVELDPFGSPSPFIFDSCRCMRAGEKSYLSVTATDMAVLCGAHHSACLKNYGSAPLDNEFCHENAARILAAKVALTAAPFNLASEPILTFSHLHYVKMIFELEPGADRAVKAVKTVGFVSYCPKCCYRESARLPRRNSCPHCGHSLEYAGPLWIGGLWDEKLLARMQTLNAKRDYSKRGEIGKILSTMDAESKIRAYGYYDLHHLAKKMKGRIMGIEEALGSLRKKGFAAGRTHFCPTAVRTDAPHGEIISALCRSNGEA